MQYHKKYVSLHKQSMTTMTKEETLREKSAHYQHCFVNECPMHEHCLHWLVAQHTQRTDINIVCVNPMNPGVKAGRCELYREDLSVKYARGMMHFYDEMTGIQERNIRSRLIYLFSRKPYYEYRNGVRLISPKTQEQIARICREEGWTGELHYDGWEEDFQW